MNKSFIDRIFPSPANSTLPRYEDQSIHQPSAASSPPQISLRSSPRSQKSSSPSSRSSLKQAPLSASIVHYDDPFLPIDRATKSLERTIQGLLDAQSDGLNASLTGGGFDDATSSVGSVTPTPSVVTPSRSHVGLKTVPIRQPVPKKINLRSARKGLARSMQQFSQLKSEELHVIDAEAQRRKDGLKRLKKFEGKKAGITAEMESARGDGTAEDVESLRQEASKVEDEIKELEEKLFGLRARHRHLLDQAGQMENTIDSKLSSYKQSLALVERDVRQFLRQPPVSGSLSAFDESGTTRSGMYSLTPERRTLQMAQEQWTTEQDMLAIRRGNVEAERQALQEGAEVWLGASERIKVFEKELRKALKTDPGSDLDATRTTDILLNQIRMLIISLKADFEMAESKNWNLLICALGAELEALEQGRKMLGGVDDRDSEVRLSNGTMADQTDDESNNPPDDLLNGASLNSPGANSNQSLEDTLREFGEDPKGKQPVREDSQPDGSAFHAPQAKSADSREESEDDDPGPDFLLSH